MTISARDQASKVLEGVEKKVSNFGKQFGQQLVGMVAPMAVVGFALGKISQKIEEIRQKRKEAFDWGASLQASANKMGVTVEEFQAIESAADETGESVEKVGKSFKLASDLIASAKSGNLAAAESLNALGVDLNKLETTTPQEVLRKLAEALSSTEDPAERAKIAVGALGKAAAELQETLAKGFDIAGAMEGVETLSNEEAALLRQQARNQRKKANDERVKEAKKQATEAFLEEDPEGQKIVAAERAKLQESLRAGGADPRMVDAAGRGITAGSLAGNANIQKRVGEALARREKEKADKDAAAAAATAEANRKRAADLKKKGEGEEKKKEEEEKKKPKEKKLPKFKASDTDDVFQKSQPTVSSLRAIGGGMAGEVAGLVDFQRNSIELQKQIRDILKEINGKGGLENTDFTKPVPNIVPVPTLGRGKGPTMVA
jgi:hypothetical protein